MIKEEKKGKDNAPYLSGLLTSQGACWVTACSKLWLTSLSLTELVPPLLAAATSYLPGVKEQKELKAEESSISDTKAVSFDHMNNKSHTDIEPIATVLTGHLHEAHKLSNLNASS